MQDAVAQVKERIDLAELVGGYVPLKQMGQHFKGLCPFHQEKTPSFVVSPERGIWHCFGCGAGGDAFSFLQQKEGMEFREALELLAERAGVTLEAQAPQQRSERARRYELLALASQFYQEILLRQSAGERAKTYLTERGVAEETMEQFGIGYAPQAWDALQKFLARKHFSPEEMMAAGVVGKSQRGTYYDRFRGRIMFPIHDLQGRVVAFGGRITPWHATGNEGKYVNSPETALYEKRRIVYNLHRAKQVLRQGEACVVVEGYMDVVLLTQAGFPQVVASSGTAFTSEQVQQIGRYTDTLHFAFDSDAAGVKAARTATEAALAAGMRVATILFPAGKDPADMALEAPEQLQTYLSSPRSLVAVLLEQLKAAQSGTDRQQQLEAVLPFVKRVTNPVQQGEMVQELAAVLHVPETVVLEQLAQVSVASAPAFPQRQSTDTSVALSLEQQLIGMLLVVPTVREYLFSELERDQFTDPRSQQVFDQLVERFSEAGLGEPQAVLAQLPEELLPFLQSVSFLTEERLAQLTHTPEVEAQHLVQVIQRKHIIGRIHALQQELTAEAGERRDAVLQEVRELTQRLAALSL